MIDPRHIPLPRRFGFSMLELIVVMVLLAIMAAIAAPSLSGFAANRRLHDTAGSMLAIMLMARAQAISEGRAYRFNLDPQLRRYYLTAQEGATFTALQTELGRDYPIADDLAVEWLNPAAGAEESFIQFTPTGESDAATIRLVGAELAELHITAEAIGERFRIIDPRDPQEASTHYSNAALTNTSSRTSGSRSGGTGGGGMSGGASSGGASSGGGSGGGMR